MKDTYDEWIQTVHGREVFDWTHDFDGKSIQSNGSARTFYSLGSEHLRCTRKTLLVSSYYGGTGTSCDYARRVLVRLESEQDRVRRARNMAWYINQKFDSRNLDFVR